MNANLQTEEADRVRRHTQPEVLNRLDEEIEERVRFYATQPDYVLTRRIDELNREWDMERWLETNASALALVGAVLGLTRNRRWLLLTCGVLGFLFQHAVSGWCPPLPVLRRLGVRTRREIDREVYALKALRGDFDELPPEQPKTEIPVGPVLDAVQS